MEKRLFIEISSRVQLTIKLVSVPSTEPIKLEIINVNVELKYLKVFIIVFYVF
jgi:hypothetical protein